MAEGLPGELNVAIGLASGTRIARYVLESRVGVGGMAVVFRARDEQLSRTVALKLLVPSMAVDNEFRQRFIRESRAAAAVEDPHIIPVYAAGEADGVLYIAMRLVEGGDLRSLLLREAPLSPGRAMDLLSPVAFALDAAHAVGLVHRDVKPANILVDTRQGRPDHVYLSDFGLSKGAAAGASLTGSGFFLGTPDYAAPEQASGRPVDGRADQYALACVTFELLAGARPFTHQSPVAVLMAHASQPVPSLAALRPDLPPAVDLVMARALAKAPEDRYPGCGEFAEELRQALGMSPYRPDGPVTATPGTAGAPSARPAPDGEPEASRTGAGGTAPDSPSEAVATATLAPPRLAGPREAPALASRPRPGPALRARGLRGHRLTRRAWAALAGLTLLVVTAILVPVLVSPGSLWQPGSQGGGSQSASPPPRTPTSAPARKPFTLTLRNELPDPLSQYPWLSFTPDGRELYTDDGLWDLGTRTYHLLFGNNGDCWAGLSLDGSALASTCGPTGADVWSVASHGLNGSVPIAAGDHVVGAGMVFSPDSRTLAALVLAPGSDKVYEWDVASHRLKTVPLPGAGYLFGYSPGGKTLAFCGRIGVTGSGGHLYLGDAASGRVTATLNGGDGAAFDASGTLLASPSLDGKVFLYRLASRGAPTLIATMAGPRVKATSTRLAFTPDGAFLVETGGGSTYVWNVASHREVARVGDPGGRGPLALAISRDGRTMAVKDLNGKIYLWTITGG